MTLVILTILMLACVLIATENVTKVNRAAVAIFAGTVGWVLYICFGMDFVTSEHSVITGIIWVSQPWNPPAPT